MKKIIVTGGLGFIGSNFIKHIFNKSQKLKASTISDHIVPRITISEQGKSLLTQN